MTGRIRDIGQNVVQYYFEAGISSSSPTYFHICFFIVLRETFIKNVIVTLCNNYVIIMCINDSNEVINDKYGRPLPQDILLFKISMGTLNGFFSCVENFGTRLKKVRQPCPALDDLSDRFNASSSQFVSKFQLTRCIYCQVTFAPFCISIQTAGVVWSVQ